MGPWGLTEFGMTCMQPADTAKTIVILVAEDEMLVRMATTDVLQDRGYHVVEARDGVEALAILELRDDVAALLTDVAMPNLNGIALAKVVATRWPRVGIVIMSGAIPADLQLPQGAHFLPKPFDPGRLVQEIESVLPRLGGPVALKSLATVQPGREFGAGGLAHPLPSPEE
jgi:CheY-like chemotaxis protein